MTPSSGIAIPAIATAASPRYSIVDIGVQLGDFTSFASDINNRGQVVGAMERDYFSPSYGKTAS